MLRDGPIPPVVHGALEYAVGVLFVAAPFLLGFDDGAATAIAIVVGVALIFVAASTDGPTSLTNSIPVTAHVALDYVLAIFLIGAPFVAGFSDETTPTVFFIGLGVAHMLVTVGTRFRPEATPSGGSGSG